MKTQDGQIRISVSPEPTPEEMAALSAIVIAVAEQQSNETGEDLETGGGRRVRWARAGRREVLRPFDRDQ